jgi:hypothetical protein
MLDRIGPYLVLFTIVLAGVVLFGLGVCVQAISVPVFVGQATPQRTRLQLRKAG